MTGNTERESALTAVQTGAFDYQMKPIDLAALKVVLQRAAYLRGVEAEVDSRVHASEQAARFEEIVGTTEVMRQIFSMAKRVAKTDATVLIEGESGMGKELLARAIHTRSPRHAKPFVAINCGAIRAAQCRSARNPHPCTGAAHRAPSPARMRSSHRS